MNIITFAPTLYYLLASLFMITFGSLIIVAAYHFMHAAKKIRNILNNLSEISDETKVAIEDIIENLSSLPILSFFMRGRGKKENKRKQQK